VQKLLSSKSVIGTTSNIFMNETERFALEVRVDASDWREEVA
jgi:hypothetical protein